MKILEFPELIQNCEYDCGAKALQAVLAYYGIDVEESVVLRAVGTTKKSGTPIKGIENTLKNYGLKYKSGSMNLKDIKCFIDKKIPVILLVQAWTEKRHVDWEKDWNDGHFVVAIGYDKKRVYFEDPFSFERTFLSYDELNDRWHGVDDKGVREVRHGIAVFGRKPLFSLKRKVHMS